MVDQLSYRVVEDKRILGDHLRGQFAHRMEADQKQREDLAGLPEAGVALRTSEVTLPRPRIGRRISALFDSTVVFTCITYLLQETPD